LRLFLCSGGYGCKKPLLLVNKGHCAIGGEYVRVNEEAIFLGHVTCFLVDIMNDSIECQTIDAGLRKVECKERVDWEIFEVGENIG